MRFYFLGQLDVPEQLDVPKKQTSATQPPRSYVTSLSFPGVEVHIKEHSFPLHIATCGICQYWKPGGLVRPRVLLGESVRQEAELVGLQLGGPGLVLAMRELRRGT